MSKNKRFDYSKYIKQLELFIYDSSFAFAGTINPGNIKIVVYYNKIMRNNIDPNGLRGQYKMTSDERSQSVFGLEKFIYINKYNVMDMFGLVDKYSEYGNQKLSIKWTKVTNSIPFLKNEFIRKTGRSIGFYREYQTFSTDPVEEAKVPDYLELGFILMMAEHLYNFSASDFRYDLNTQLEKAIYGGYSTIDITKIPFIDNLIYIVNRVKDIEASSISAANK